MGQQHIIPANLPDIKTVKTGHKSVFIMCSYYSQDSQTIFRSTRNLIFQYIYIKKNVIFTSLLRMVIAIHAYFINTFSTQLNQTQKKKLSIA